MADIKLLENSSLVVANHQDPPLESSTPQDATCEDPTLKQFTLEDITPPDQVIENASRENRTLTQPTNEIPEKEPACFTSLPLEIRTMIWSYIASFPRNITPRHKGKFCMKETTTMKGTRSVHTYVDMWKQKYYTNTPVPTMLHVCQEARAIGLTIYSLHLDSGEHFKVDYEELWESEAKWLLPSTIYMNWEADTLALTSQWSDTASICGIDDRMLWQSALVEAGAKEVILFDAKEEKDVQRLELGEDTLFEEAEECMEGLEKVYGRELGGQYGPHYPLAAVYYQMRELGLHNLLNLRKYHLRMSKPAIEALEG
ncbi:hypothetical protein B0J14DRAFT_639260 [Halenospora varia]|nr:hypothetical protein B0J14DRAFT_639260 [Halenospora varia]